MTESELHHAVRAIALAVADIQQRLSALEAFCLSMNRRLLANSAEIARYEYDEEKGRTIN